MKDVFEFSMVILLIIASFVLGSVVGITRVQNSCDKLSSFYVDNKVYECQAK
jgi:hypothetical protein